MSGPVDVMAEPTPNPNAYKFTLDRAVTEGGSRSFVSPEQAAADPLASRLFTVDGVRSLFFLNNFITVTRDPARPWEELVPAVVEVIRDHFDVSP
ncbi:MAG: NifU N-terminal domain-containing protein [Firmicutes bacterium]|nr:NifU N-terminal domain-containing protein [Bacillota bacterium]